MPGVTPSASQISLGKVTWALTLKLESAGLRLPRIF